MIRSTLILGISFLLSLSTQAQQTEIGDEYYPGEDSLAVLEKESATSVHMSMGTGVSSGFNGGTMVNSYIAPYVSHQLSPRWKLSFGTAVVNSNFDRWRGYSFDRNMAANGTITYQQVFLRADYQLSEDLTVYGAVYHNLLTLDVSPGAAQLSLPGNAWALGMEYKLSDHMRIGVQMSQSSGYGYRSPFFPSSMGFGGYSGGYMSPFGPW